MSHVIHPGEYFIELEFDRPVDPAVLHRALTSMGFGVVVFDQSLPTVEIGAVMSPMSRAMPSTASRLASLSSSSVMASSAQAVSRVAPVTLAAAKYNVPVSRPAAPPPPPPPSSSRTVMAVQSRYSPSSSVAMLTTPMARVVDGGGAAALKPSAASLAFQKQGLGSLTINPSTPISRLSPALPTSKFFPGDVVAHPKVTAPGPMYASPATPAAGPSGSYSTFDPPAPDTSTPLAPSASPPAPPEPKGQFVAPPADGGGGGGYVADKEEATYEEAPAEATPPPPSAVQQTPAPMPTHPAPSRQEVAPALVAKALTELWTKWKEWGSPFASGPMTISGSGGASDDDPLRFRVLARLDRPITLNDTPHMRWLFVKALSVPLLSGDLAFQSNPHPLRQGSLYELRFLSRAKSNPTRDSVKQTLAEMGFQPVKLLAIKRNMKLPNRPASLTLWYGMAVWNHADSVIVHDDPFFFETVKEIRPL